MASSINASTSGSGGVITTADNTGILNLQTASTTAVTVDASQNVTVAGNTYLASTSGNVGIGTTTPTTYGDSNTKLAVYKATSGATYVNTLVGTDNVKYATYINDWSAGSDQIVKTGTSTSHAYAFLTNGTERMRIDNIGNIGIGNSSPNTRLIVSANTGTAVQRIFNLVGTNTYQMSFHNSTQECGTITTGNNTVGYNSNSDYRLKENIAPMTSALEKVSLLKPVTYTWKASGTDGQGFIAHELQEHFPDAVSGEKDAVDEEGNPVYQGIDTSFLVATLTAAIQEQQTIINNLKARVTALEAK